MMPRTKKNRLIVNSPNEEPARRRRYDRATRTLDLAEGRRPAGASWRPRTQRSFDDPSVFVEIRSSTPFGTRVKAWREACYPGVSAVTRRLLCH